MPRSVKEIRREPPAVAVLLKVAAYCRVSSDSEDQLHSYAAQINLALLKSKATRTEEPKKAQAQEDTPK